MGETVEAIGYKADVKSRVKESLVEKKDAAISKVTGAMPETDGVSRGAKKTVGVAKENPLGLAVGGIAVGFLVGLLLPATRGRTSGSVKSATRFARASRTPDRKPWNGASTSRRKPPTQPQQQRGTAAANRPRTWPRHQGDGPGGRLHDNQQLRGLGLVGLASTRGRCVRPRVLTRKAGCLRSRRTCVSQQVDEGEHAGHRRDRRSRFPGWIEVQGRSSIPLQEAHEDLGHDPAAHRPESLGVVRRQLGLPQDVEPEWRFAAPSRSPLRPSVALERTFMRIAFATCWPDGRPTRFPRSVLRTARWVVGSGGGTTDPGRSVSGNRASCRSCAACEPRGRVDGKDVLPLDDQVGRDRAAVEVEAPIRAEDRDAAAVQRRLVDHVERANDAGRTDRPRRRTRSA